MSNLCVVRMIALPSRIAFEISIFPSNVPLPAPKTSACIFGGIFHLIHFCIRVSQIRSIPDSDIGWEDMYREDNNVAWFDWVCSSYLCMRTERLLKTVLYVLDGAYDGPPDHRRIIEHTFPIHTYETLPPPPSTRPCLVPTRPLRLCAN